MSYKKDELINNLASALVAILLGCIVVICIIVNLPNTKEIDGALISSVLTGGVTLFAPIAAYYLLSDWKEQHNASIDTDYKKRIIEVIREISPIEIKYGNMLSNYFIYKGNSIYTFPLVIDKNEIQKLFEKINLLSNLIKELSETTEDPIFQKDLNNILNYYFKYAQLYPVILNSIHEMTSTEYQSDKILNFLGKQLKFKFFDGSNEYSSSTLYADALDGIRITKIRKFFLNQLKIR